MIEIYVLLGLSLLIIIYVIGIYNRLVKLRVRVGEAWSDIEVQMKRRYNLVPNLVETVKGYAGHEKETFERVVAARSAAVSSTGTPSEQGASENMLTGALKSLFALAEAYPELKANENFQDLSNQLSEIEEVIQRARRYYNGSVGNLNTLVEQFPSNFVAGQFGFSKAEFFELDEADEEARQAPKVEF
jgi:LemA protein